MVGKKNLISESLVDVYRPAFLEHGDSPLSTRQNNAETQNLRFRQLTQHLFQPGEEQVKGMSGSAIPTIYDVGSGLCDLHSYLLENDIRHLYAGCEIVPEMVEFSRKKYPNIKIDQIDFLASPEDEKFDFIVSSGVFNMPGCRDDQLWKAYCLSLITRMFEKSQRGISFNCLTSYRTFSAKDLYYFEPAEILQFMLGFTRFVVVDHAYPLYEFTVSAFKEEEVKARNSSPLFEKYYRS